MIFRLDAHIISGFILKTYYQMIRERSVKRAVIYRNPLFGSFSVRHPHTLKFDSAPTREHISMRSMMIHDPRGQLMTATPSATIYLYRLVLPFFSRDIGTD